MRASGTIHFDSKKRRYFPFINFFPIFIFIFGFSEKFAIKHLSCFSPLLNYVATLPCETWNATFIILPLQLLQQEAPLTLRGQRGRYSNIKEEPKIYRSFPSPRPCQLFPSCPSCVPNLMSLASLCKYWRRTPKFLEAPHPLLCLWFYDGRWQTQAVYRISNLCKYWRGTPNFEELP